MKKMIQVNLTPVKKVMMMNRMMKKWIVAQHKGLTKIQVRTLNGKICLPAAAVTKMKISCTSAENYK